MRLATGSNVLHRERSLHSTPPPAAPSDQPLLGPGARGLISVLLFAHLLLVLIALAAYPAASGLQQRLRERFSPYMKTFNFDVIHDYGASARYHLTHALPTDIDFTLEVESPGGGPDSRTIVPAQGLWPRQRYERYQALANTAGSLAENTNLQSAIPKSVAASVLNARGKSQGVVRCRAHYLVPLESMTAGGAKRNPNDPSYFTTVYEADVLISAGQVDLIKRSSAAETAPVDRREPGP